jgi:signal transduction histidine kinase
MSDGKVTAVIKVRRNLEKVMDQNHRSLPPLMALSALASAFVFLALWFVIRKADHIIKSQQQQIAEANRQLADHNRQLEVLNARKDEFLAICSHDLRSPLTSISLGCSILLKERTGPLAESQRDILMRSKRSVETMVTLIDRLLDVARIESGTETVELESCDLVKTIEESMALHAAQAQERGVAFELKLAGTELPVIADRVKLLRICNNLLSNAVKHSPPGTVRIEASADASSVQFSVIDQGPGLSREEQATLFDRFSALARRKKTRASGTGLGLFITRALVEMHGGKIDVESKPGHGATFRVTLPSRSAAPIERVPGSREHSHA